jgi:ABC-type nitrate/sulfonate/bicarbonate transport system substrate-binding protein
MKAPRVVLFLGLLALAGCGGAAAGQPAPASPGASASIGVPPLSARGKLHIALPEGNTAYVAFYAALDRGYFQQAGLDVTADHFRGSVTQQLPRLATGDIDFLPVPPSPAAFNQVQQGFGIKLVAGMDRARPDKPVSGWLMVLPGEKDQIKDYSDLKGKTVEGGAQGSPADVYAREAIARGNLTPDRDVKLRYDLRGDPSDLLNVAKNHAADVLVAPSPLWVPVEQQGLAARWKSADETAPWYQTNGLGFSSKALSQNRAAVVKFLQVYLATARQIDANNGDWTPELVNSVVKWSFGADTPDMVRGAGAVIAYDPNGALDLDSLHKVEYLWLQEGLIKQKVDDAALLDTGPLQEALAGLPK